MSNEIIVVNLSTPFLIKNKCKECGSNPVTYFYVRNKTLWIDPNRIIQSFDLLKKYYKRMCSDYYMKVSPKYFNDLSHFSYYTLYKSYLPKLHHTRGRDLSPNVSEFLMCECGATSWIFSNLSAKKCPEVVNRKSRYSYPHKFDF